MRKVLVIVGLAGGCFLHHGLLDVGIEARVDELTTCHCHHGFGPGADARVELVMDNASGRTVEFFVVEARFERADGVSFSDAASVGRGAVYAMDLPVGRTQLDLTPYVDFIDDAEGYAGSYRCYVDVSLDGVTRTIDAGTVDAVFVDVPFE